MKIAPNTAITTPRVAFREVSLPGVAPSNETAPTSNTTTPSAMKRQRPPKAPLLSEQGVFDFVKGIAATPANDPRRGKLTHVRLEVGPEESLYVMPAKTASTHDRLYYIVKKFVDEQAVLTKFYSDEADALHAALVKETQRANQCDTALSAAKKALADCTTSLTDLKKRLGAAESELAKQRERPQSEFAEIEGPDAAPQSGADAYKQRVQVEPKSDYTWAWVAAGVVLVGGGVVYATRRK
jgi:hypothetical protein